MSPQYIPTAICHDINESGLVHMDTSLALGDGTSARVPGRNRPVGWTCRLLTSDPSHAGAAAAQPCCADGLGPHTRGRLF
jgi:hypothetical protein